MNRKRGFTLIEVLIVVVIIGVLAALIIPRFLSAPEKAIVAEANQLVGSMVRAQQANIDVGGTFITVSDNVTATTWNKLGLSTPGTAVASGASGAKFNYTCTSPSCSAVRSGATNKSVVLNSSTGAWTCGSEYTSLSYGGCTLG